MKGLRARWAETSVPMRLFLIASTLVLLAPWLIRAYIWYAELAFGVGAVVDTLAPRVTP